MNIRNVAILAALAATGCNQLGSANDTAMTNTVAPAPAPEGPGTIPSPVADDNAARFDKYSRCAVAMLEMSRIYTVLAKTDTSGKRADLEESSEKRLKMGRAFYDLALERGESIGKTKADIEMIRREVDAEYKRAREQDFTAFAEKVAGDSDECEKLARDTP